MAKINAGGSASSGSGIAIELPRLPGEADVDKAGALLERTLKNNMEDQKSKSKYFFLFSE
jgi:type VI secretion system secreted protein VgrG